MPARAAAAVLLMLGAGMAAAQDRPPPSPTEAPSAPEATTGAADDIETGDSNTGDATTGDAPPPPVRPENAGSAPGAAASPASPPAAASPARETAPPALGRPGAIGRLIPPGEAIPEWTASAPPAPPVPTGPPAHSLLREDDFAYAACRLELMRLGTVYTEEAPVTGDDRDCGIDRPLKVTEALPGVTLEGGALMRCDTARALAWWLRDFVQPAARRLPGAPQVRAMTPGSTYQCRATVGASTTALSEHSLGNAIDIAAFTFDNGTTLPVAATGEGNAQQSFLLAVRWAGCMDFTTVLGPGSNAAHADHLHLDIKARRGGYRLCE